MRFSAPPKAGILETLDEFFATVEKLQCQALYDQLYEFWTTDPYNIRSIDQFEIQEKEVVRAIIKWTLALKENEHQCAEDKWPSAEQRLALFRAAKETIDETDHLAWLQSDALYAVLATEIGNLEENQ